MFSTLYQQHKTGRSNNLVRNNRQQKTQAFIRWWRVKMKRRGFLNVWGRDDGNETHKMKLQTKESRNQSGWIITMDKFSFQALVAHVECRSLCSIALDEGHVAWRHIFFDFEKLMRMLNFGQWRKMLWNDPWFLEVTWMESVTSAALT